MNKVTLEKLTVELTEKCNMKCPHCCKGEAGNTDIDLSHIDNLLNQVDRIEILSLIGGEPTLNINAIQYVYEAIRKRNIPLFEFQIITNGMVYDERFIEIIKQYKELIDTSCKLFDSLTEKEYNSSENLYRCTVGVSLDRFHSNHDVCFANYEKYKLALTDYAEVIKKMTGNSPFRIGRAKELKEKTWEHEYQLEFLKQQRIELFSREYTSPACKFADQYKLIYNNQKIVCCCLYMNAYGNLYIGHSEVVDRETVNTFPVICKAGDPLWESLIEYNKDKIPCTQCMSLIHEKAKATDNLNSLEKAVFDAYNNAVDEITEHEARIRKERWIEAAKNAEKIFTIKKKQFHDSFEQMVKSNPLSAKLLLYVAGRKGYDADYLRELREEFFPEITERINKDDDIKLIKASMSNIKKLLELWPDNALYQKILRSDERKLLDHELRILMGP